MRSNDGYFWYIPKTGITGSGSRNLLLQIGVFSCFSVVGFLLYLDTSKSLQNKNIPSLILYPFFRVRVLHILGLRQLL